MGTLNNRCRTIIRTQKGTLILTIKTAEAVKPTHDHGTRSLFCKSWHEPNTLALGVGGITTTSLRSRVVKVRAGRRAMMYVSNGCTLG